MIKVLVATAERQGERASDFCWTVEGEPVRFPFVCDADARSDNPDGGCGCGRSFAGLSSLKATTTAKVAELDMSASDYRRALSDSSHASGWAGLTRHSRSSSIAHEARDLLALAAMHPVGTVLEKRGDVVQPRL